MKTFNQLVSDCRKTVQEIFPWDLIDLLENAPEVLLLDVREANEFAAAHIKNSINIPRGILEAAGEFGFAETNPRLASDKSQLIVVICRSGNRSLFAAKTLGDMGFSNAVSLQTGLKGWNDYEQILIDANNNTIDAEFADRFFSPQLSPEQLGVIGTS